MKRKRRGQVVGFVVTPDAIKDKVASLDAAIAVLDGDIRASSSPKLDAAWRAEWNAFVRRWAVERDSYASWTSRFFATYAVPRIEAFEANYRWWARDFERRTKVAPNTAKPKTPEGALDAVVPNVVWWILGGAAALWVVTSQARKAVSV